MAVSHETSEAAALRLEGIHREGVVISAARMCHMVGASSEGTTVPRIDEIKYERGMNADVGLKTLCGLPRPIPDTSDLVDMMSSRVERDSMAVAGERKAVTTHSPCDDLESFEGTVDIADRSP